MATKRAQYMVRPDAQVVLILGAGGAVVRLQPGSGIPDGIPQKVFEANVKRGNFILDPAGIERPVQAKGANVDDERKKQAERAKQRKGEGEKKDEQQGDAVVGALAAKDALKPEDLSGLDVEKLNLLAVERGYEGEPFEAYADALAFLTKEAAPKKGPAAKAAAG